MNRMAVAATAVVLLNLLIATIHGLSHVHAGVPLEPWQHAFVQVTVYAIPLLSAVLYWTPPRAARRRPAPGPVRWGRPRFGPAR